LKDCDPSDYLTAEQHENLCKKSYDSIMNWAHQVAEDSVKDRGELHKKVEDLKDLIPKFQWWFIGLLAAVIISSIIGPKYFGQNGQDAKFRELAGYIAAVTGQVEEQKDLITKGNEISQANQGKLDKLEKEMRKK
jgi:hypothetical protein